MTPQRAEKSLPRVRWRKIERFPMRLQRADGDVIDAMMLVPARGRDIPFDWINCPAAGSCRRQNSKSFSRNAPAYGNMTAACRGKRPSAWLWRM